MKHNQSISCTDEQAAAFEAIVSERDYQDRQVAHNYNDPAPRKSMEEFVLYMDDYMRELKTTLSRTWGPEAYEKSGHILRKVLALGVACAEQHDLPFRDNDPTYSGVKPQ